MADPTTEPLRVDFVIGVTPDKWARTWAERHPQTPLALTPVDAEGAEARLREGASALSLLRLPVVREGLHVIALYEEQPVAMVAKDHAAAAFDELDVLDIRDLSGEVLLQPADSVPGWRDAAPPEVRASAEALGPMTTAEAVAVAAAGSGFVVVPLSVARALHRKDVVHRPLTGVDGSTVALAWRVDDDDPRIEDFVGVVRGRTARSSRGRTPDATGTGPDAAVEPGTAGRKTAAKDTPGSPRKGGARHTSGRSGAPGAPGSSGGRSGRGGRATPQRGRGRKGR